MDTATLAKQIADYDSTRKSSNDVLNDAMTKYGIPEIRSRVAGLRTTLSNTENALNAVDPSVTGRTQGSLVTEAQRSRQVANERAPIAEQYGQQSRALATESANQSDALSAAKLLAENQINDYNTGRQALQSRYEIANSQEMERRRREEADREFSLKKQAAAQAATGYNLGGNSTKPTDPLKQIAHDDVYTRVAKQSDAELISDFNATRQSAEYGNAKDRAKLEFYAAYRPDLFGPNGRGLARPAPTPSVGVATPGQISSVGVAQPTGRVRVG